MSEQASESRAWTPASIRELAMGFQASRVLLTAVELRAFSLITDDGATSDEVAARAGCDPRAINDS